MDNKIKLKAYFDIGLAMSISGSAVVVSKMMVANIPSFLATEFGIVIGLLILIPITFVIKKEDWKLDLRTHLVLFAQALFGISLYRIFTLIGLQYTTAATSGLITSASPVVIAVLAFIILKERMSFTNILGIFSVFTGLLLINLYTYFSSDSGYGSMKGNMFIMAAVLCGALFSILSKARCKPVSAMCRTTMIAFYAFVILLPFSVHDAASYDFGKMESSTVLCILYYGIFVSFLSYILWFRGIEKVQASNAAVFTSMAPVSAVILSAVLLRERIYPIHLISLLCIVAGIWISCLDEKTEKDRKIKIQMRKNLE